MRSNKPGQQLSKHVIIIVQYNCGCSFFIKNEAEAKFHCQVTGHTVSVSGEVKCV